LAATARTAAAVPALLLRSYCHSLACARTTPLPGSRCCTLGGARPSLVHLAPVTELKTNITERYADLSLTCPPGGLNSKVGRILQALCDQFNDLSSMDKLASVQAKVDGVKDTMRGNIDAALRNTDKLDDLDDRAVAIAASAGRFKDKTGDLKRTMQWRYIRMVIIMTLVIGAVLAVIIVPIVLTQKK